MSNFTNQIPRQTDANFYLGEWIGLAGITEVQLQTVSSGRYTFGVNPLINTQGYQLYNPTTNLSLQVGVDFNYNEYLDSNTGGKNIYDTSVGGSFATGKYFRIVENGKNVVDPTGLSLRVRAKMLTKAASPPYNECWVDPISGKFKLPGPIYWAKLNGDFWDMEYTDGTTAIIGNGVLGTTTDYIDPNTGLVLLPKGKFNGGTGVTTDKHPFYDAGGVLYTGVLTIFPRTTTLGFDQGTLSWWQGNVWGNGSLNYFNQNTLYTGGITGVDSTGGISIGGSATTPWQLVIGSIIVSNIKYEGITLVINGVVVKNRSQAGLPNVVWPHMYMLWDKNASLSESQSVQLFINGVKYFYYDQILPDTSTYLFTVQYLPFYYWIYDFKVGGNYYGVVTYLDNIKFFDSILASYEWDYNGGVGNENALGPQYTEGGIPNFLTNASGVGYYCLITGSTTPITVNESKANQNQLILNSTISQLAPGMYSFSKGIGKYINGSTPNILSAPMVEGVDFIYNEALDGTGPNAINIFDTEDAGALASGKYIRLLHNDVNVMSEYLNDGLNLTPVAKLIDNYWENPEKTECWIDPIQSYVVFPRPTFWSKCDSLQALTKDYILAVTTPKIYTQNLVVNNVNVKFNKGLQLYNEIYGQHGTFSFYPYGNSSAGIHTQTGTLSVWMQVACLNSFQNSVYVKFILAYNAYIILYNFARTDKSYAALYVNNIQVDLYDTLELLNISHFYVVWDSNKTLYNNSSIRVFINGVERLKTSENILIAEPYIEGSLYNNPVGICEILLDNLKMWRHMLTEDPAWEYNDGIGRENNLHYIYGLNANYQPNLLAAYYSYLTAGNKAIIAL
jgi:hypothetical protein